MNLKRFCVGIFLVLLLHLIPSVVNASLSTESSIIQTTIPASTAASLSPSEQPMVYDLPYPGLLPDHPLYIIKVFRDRIVLLFTRDQLRRIEIKRHLADKRLSMGKALINKGKIELGASTMSKGEKYLFEAVKDTHAYISKTPEINQTTIDILLVATINHEAIIQQLLNDAPLIDRESLGLSFQIAQESEREIRTVKSDKL